MRRQIQSAAHQHRQLVGLQHLQRLETLAEILHVPVGRLRERRSGVQCRRRNAIERRFHRQLRESDMLRLGAQMRRAAQRSSRGIRVLDHHRMTQQQIHQTEWSRNGSMLEQCVEIRRLQQLIDVVEGEVGARGRLNQRQAQPGTHGIAQRQRCARRDAAEGRRGIPMPASPAPVARDSIRLAAECARTRTVPGCRRVRRCSGWRSSWTARPWRTLQRSRRPDPSDCPCATRCGSRRTSSPVSAAPTSSAASSLEASFPSSGTAPHKSSAVTGSMP